MKKKAVLVCVSLMTRVIVDDNATDEQIMEIALPKFKDKLEFSEAMDNLESIEDDTEMPYDPEKCLNCGHEFEPNPMRIRFDELGRHTSCVKCGASFDMK